MRKLLVVLVGASLLAPGTAHAKLPPTRDILTVGNNWDGTADLVDPRRFKVLKRLNIVPDKDQRMAEIQADPVRLGYFLGIRHSSARATTSSSTTRSPRSTAASSTCRGRRSPTWSRSV